MDIQTEYVKRMNELHFTQEQKRCMKEKLIATLQPEKQNNCK